MVIGSGTPMLELRGVSKRFGAVVALRDGELTLHPGSMPWSARTVPASRRW